MYAAVPYSPLVSGLTTTNTTSAQEICGDGSKETIFADSGD